jgi:Zn-dependent protease with chaperone function
MKRYLSGLVSLSLILLTPPPAAWAQFAAVAGRASAPVGLPVGVQAVGAPSAAAISLPVTSLSSMNAPALSAAFSAPMSAPMPQVAAAAGLAVAPASVAVPAARALALTATRAASLPVSAPAVAVPVAAPALAATPAASVSDGLNEAARSLKAPDARPETVLERLFTGGSARAAASDLAAPALSGSAAANSGLEPAAFRGASGGSSVPSPAQGPNAPKSGKLVGALKMIGTVTAAAAATLGLNALAVALAPSLFAVVPIAALWAVSSGVLLFPAALYARYRLAKRDSPRLAKVKLLLDGAIGLYVGALLVAGPAGWLTLGSVSVTTSILPAAGLAVGMATRGAPFLNSVLVWGALGLAPLAIGAAAVGGLAIAPILGMLALPAMTTIAFFLGSLITAAETGRPFSVPGSLQKMRFPSFQWVMIGVVFALLTGYSAVHTNLAFLAWNFLGSRTPAAWDKSLPLWKNVLNKAASFDVLYLGLLAFTAVTGFTSPLTFLVIAFSGERAAVWTERLLTRFLPRANPAPSTKAAPVSDDSAPKDAHWPAYHYWAKTVGILAAMAGIGVIMGFTVFGFHSWLMSMIPAALMAFLPFFFATKIIKVVMHDTPADEKTDPEFFAIMKNHREHINAQRRAAGKKEIPMPEMVIDPLPLPNAYATGRDPMHALVGVTVGIKEMTLDPENVRDGVARLISNTNPSSKAFKVFRLAISGSITGVTTASSPADIQAAVLKADRVELKALGVRMLSGVLGHEFSHVMDRHMLSGSIAGAISSSIAFASYGVMWAVGHAQIAGKKLMDKILGRKPLPVEPSIKGDDAAEEGSNKTLVVEPITAGLAVKSLPALLKLFAALWVPVLVQIVQMASSRNNEGMADEDGAHLSEDPESLALALGLLTTWRPKSGFMLPGTTLPRVVALSHIMTVNPIEQAWQAGALPKLDAFTEAVVGKGDDFLFDLFVTHPDTIVRIEKLHDMAEALRAEKAGSQTARR